MRKTKERILVYRFQVVGCEEAAHRNPQVNILAFRDECISCHHFCSNESSVSLNICFQGVVAQTVGDSRIKISIFFFKG